MESIYLVELHDSGRYPELGAKVAGLRWLEDHGFSVPSTFICTHHVYDLTRPEFSRLQMMERVLTIPEVAEHLQRSKTSVYSLVKKGVIPSIQIDRNVRIFESDCEKWLEEQRRPSRQI